uniref:Uncharacterized protein n=1 Tax=Cacopsylla melanoneura TaxID=428564 RepID=A0A8D8W752_9HEMI
MPYPQPLEKHRLSLKIMGLLQLNPCRKKWQNRCATIFNRGVYIVGTIALVSHILSTTTRSIRYMPEFFQRLAEDLAFNGFSLECLVYVINDQQLLNLMKAMRTHFSQANRTVVESCVWKDRVIFYGGLLATTFTLMGSIVDSLIPVSEEQTELLR